MLIRFHTQGLMLSDALRGHIENYVTAALRPYGRDVKAVTVRFKDLNGGRGGPDKRCRLVAVLPQRRLVIAEGLDADAYTSVEQAAHRLRRVVSKALERSARHGRWSKQRPQAIRAPGRLIAA